MQQLSFEFSNLLPSYAEADFIVSDHNRVAWNWIKNWPNWPSYGLIIYGPPGCGKTHLGCIWAKQAGAVVITSLSQINFLSIKTPVFLDISKANQEKTDHFSALFHLLNHCAVHCFSLLMTSHLIPSAWYTDLPDIRSRLHSLPNVPMGVYGDQAYAIIQKWLIDQHFPCPSAKAFDMLIETYVAEPDFLNFLAAHAKEYKKSLSLIEIRQALNLYYDKT